MRLSDAARYEIDFRLRLKERDYEDAVLAAHGVTFDAVADDGLVVAGQPVSLSLLAVNRGGTDVSVSDVTIVGLDLAAGCACVHAGTGQGDAVYTCSAKATVPNTAKLTTPYFTDDYWKNPSKPAINKFEPGVPFGVPFAPTPFRVTFHVHAGSADVTKELPIQYRYVKDIYNGDKRMELNVVPAFSVRGDAVARGDSCAGWPGASRAARARDPRRGHQRHEGRGRSQRDARNADRLERDAAERADCVRARGRIAVRALPGDRADGGEAGRVHGAGPGRRRRRPPRHRATPSATRTSSTRTSSAGRSSSRPRRR